MTRLILFVALATPIAAQPSLRGTVTDPAGAVVPGAQVQLRGTRDHRLKTGPDGQYAFPALPAGKYQVRFTAGRLPPKSAIREVRINSNPFSPEYDRPGFARIEIFTKPGSDFLRGQAFVQYNDQRLNARNPLLAQATRPPFRAQIYGLNLS